MQLAMVPLTGLVCPGGLHASHTVYLRRLGVLFLAAGIVVTAQQGQGYAEVRKHSNVAKPTAAKPATQR
jgi:hypothetical protein